MDERRRDSRLLCAELVEIEWRDKSNRVRRNIANLEDISLKGVCVQLEHSIARATEVRVRMGKEHMYGHVCYCVFRDSGYFIGVQFKEAARWSRKVFQPSHLLDPQQLVQRSARRAVQSPVQR